ncbi:MAG: ferric reductase-like transmembrane domain-containing protein [Anaerolineae bacterium]
MKWLRKNWRWGMLNLFALTVLAVLLWQAGAMREEFFLDDLVENSAKWAIRFLLICLSMSPLNTYFGWRWAVGLRKTAGLWAFGFGVLHFIRYLTLNAQYLPGGIVQFIVQDYINIVGLIALLILSALAITSNRWAMRWLGKLWKRLHRMVYAAGIIMIVHGLLAYANTKRSFINNNQTTYELMVYGIVLAVLLVVRVPAVRRYITNLDSTQKKESFKSSAS